MNKLIAITLAVVFIVSIVLTSIFVLSAMYFLGGLIR